MEISPVAGIRLTPMVKAQPVDPELTALFDIESIAQTGDDTYTGSHRKAAGAEEDDEEDIEDLEEAFEDDATPRSYGAGSTSGISFFA